MIVAAAIVALMAVQTEAPAGPPTTALERALVERTCDVMISKQGPTAIDRSMCVDDQLASLRGDFGVNLGKLSAGDRGRLDRLCSPLEGAVTHEAYLDCVLGQLAPLHEKLHRAKPDAADAAVPVSNDPAPPVAVAMPAAAPKSSHLLLYGVAGGSIVVLGAAAGLFVAMKKRKPATHACSSCGAPVEDAGAMCAACRHKLAEERRHAAAERVAEAADAERRRKEAEEAAAQAELRAQEQAKQAVIDEETHRREAEDEERRRREQDATRPPIGGAPMPAEEDTFDPHAVLGVAKIADADAIRKAYEIAKAKYDPENVSHLSPEVQQHYREKGEAVERAFQMLTEQSQ